MVPLIVLCLAPMAPVLEGAIASEENSNSCDLNFLRQLIWRYRARASDVPFTFGRLLQF